MKCLITGASGFIGSHLKQYLIDQGHEVVSIPHEYLYDPLALTAMALVYSPDYIFHLAAYGNMSHQIDEDQILHANIMGTYNLLQATKDCKYKLFVNFSSSSVYGWSDQPMSEKQTLRPNTLYAATKASAEYLCRYFRKKYKRIIVNARLFSVYGPGEADYRFIPTLIKNAKENKITQVMRGNHDWIYIDDVCRAVGKIIDNAESLPHRTFNIGTGIMTSNEEIARLITENYEPIQQGKKSDSIVWVANTRRLEDLNWKPEVTIREGIKKTIAYYEK